MFYDNQQPTTYYGEAVLHVLAKEMSYIKPQDFGLNFVPISALRLSQNLFSLNLSIYKMGMMILITHIAKVCRVDQMR